MEFKDRLRELRGKRTQKEIAKLLGVPLNSYNNWENGREPSYAVLKKKCRVLSCNSRLPCWI